MSFSLFPPRGLPPLIQDYLQGKLASFTAFEPGWEGLLQAAAKRSLSEAHRIILTEVLQEQYQWLPETQETKHQIQKLLSPHTFTITTGHQLMIGGGPMFMFWKMMHTISLAEKLNADQKQFHFVPVFWMASEDHDLEEIKSVRIFQKDYTWETSQSGAVGRMHNAGIDDLVAQWAALFRPGDAAETYIQIFKEAYQLKNLSAATAFIFHSIFGERGLLILDADHPKLKGLFADYMCKDLLEEFNEPIIRETTSRLALNYKTQVSPRKVNFFKLTENDRQRIKAAGEGGHNLTENIIKASPEQFSPNVCLRPLYQEVILPNVAYVGGPGEISYWLQLKDMFIANGVSFPVLVPRHSVYLLSPSFEKKWRALGFEKEHIFLSIESLQKLYMDKYSEAPDTSALNEALKELHQSMTAMGKQIDATLIPAAESIFVKIKEQADGFIKKAEKHRKAGFDQDLAKIQKLYEELYPNGSPQDRTLNILTCASFVSLDEIFSQMKTSFSGVVVGG